MESEFKNLCLGEWGFQNQYPVLNLWDFQTIEQQFNEYLMKKDGWTQILLGASWQPRIPHLAEELQFILSVSGGAVGQIKVDLIMEQSTTC